MSRYLFIVLFSILSIGTNAQTSDSLYVVHKGANWVLKYVVKPGEFVRMLALRFYISEDAILNANEPDNIKKMGPGSVNYIPVTKENYFVYKPTFGDLHELYYRVLPKDDIGLISTYAGVTKSQMRSWNNLHGNTLEENEVLFI